MILVISKEEDISTDYFMEWCAFMRIEVVRINEYESANLTKSIFLSNGNLEIDFEIKGRKISLSEIKSVWFRRGSLRHYSELQHDKDFAKRDLKSVQVFLENESTTLNDFIAFSLKTKKCLNDQNHYNANKLITLYTAAQIGLNIPQTYISQNGVSLQAVFNGQQIITKSIQDALSINEVNFSFAPAVLAVEKLLPESEFYYSKFQHKIGIRYELRIFFIEQEYYAAAVFPKNKINKESNIPKTVPFLLPEEIARQLTELNIKLGYNSGSIDMIVDHAGTYYFLEINPVGQFDYVSKHCNYYLDKRIAQYLNNVS